MLARRFPKRLLSSLSSAKSNTHAKAINESFKSEIPIIDFSLFLHGNPIQKQQIANQVYLGFANVGFIYLINHGISDVQLSKVFNHAKKFFNLPAAEKNALAWASPESNRGYVSPGREKVSRLLDSRDIDELRIQSPDLKESMEIGKEPSPDFSNNWPKDPSFRKDMMTFFDSCHELHLELMDAIGIGLGLSRGYFTKYCNEKDHNLRLLHYPEVESKILQRQGQTRAGCHSDYGTVTLLFQDHIGGLQVKNSKGSFINAPPIEGAIVINAGDLLARWSNDKIKSTEHQVVSPPYDDVNGKYPARYSIAYFCNPNSNANIECIDGTWNDKNPKKYPPVKTSEYLVHRLKATPVPELLERLYTCETSQECLLIAEDLAGNLRANGILSLDTFKVLENFKAAAANKKSGLQREGAFLGISGLAKGMGRMAEPYLLPLLTLALESSVDKGQPVKEAGNLAAKSILDLPTPHATKLILPYIYDAMSKKWQVKVAAMELLEILLEKAPSEIAHNLPQIIVHVEECMHDTKNDVSKAAISCMTKLCSVVGNEDIEPHIEILVECMAHPASVTDCVAKLSSTTFVAEMTAPALAIMVPLLVRALNERSTSILRPTTIIVDNLCKLVNNPADAGQFLPQLLPGLDKIIETAAQEEVRCLATAAKNTLVKVGGNATSNFNEQQEKLFASLEKEAFECLTKSLAKKDSFSLVSVTYVSKIFAELIFRESFDKNEWEELSTSYLSSLMTPQQKITDFYLSIYNKYNEKYLAKVATENQVDTEEGEELCNCEFSLAYGSRMLLNKTKLRLIRGKRYGLCGANGAGKSTLMRAISLGKVDGFPPADQLKTVFVEHSLQGEEAGLSIVDFVAKDERLKNVTRNEIIEALGEVGFGEDRREQSVGTLSGGWKMKLELARAILIKADILLLDEPTNHLDVGNIKWLEDYLNSQSQVTSLIVSHDSSFLDNVCTHIIHYDTKKLLYFKGNLSKFVEKTPSAKSYYTLTASLIKFVFPPPSILLGIRSNTKAIMKMSNVSFTYPGSAKPSMSGVSVQLSLSSRVAVVGPNGAGKSTMIKLLTGELQPQSGSVWKHPNLRVGYVAQHAFHHLNEHLEKTPNGYLQWRYQGGQDKEILEKSTRQMTEEDVLQMKKPISIDGDSRQIEYLVGRSKLKKSFQYEIKWVNKAHKFNSWFAREELLSLGFNKIIQAYDDQEASREGQGYRELIPSVIRKHFEDIGLDGDVADNNPVGGLSGGQKVKVVLAAAMWNNPHMLVLDEPTNYLDRDSLGGLAVAIRDWGGAVIMISHNTEFIGALCPETWNIESGRLTAQGVCAVEESRFEDQDAAAQKIDAKVGSKPKKKKMTRNDVKAQEIRRRARHMKWLIEGGVKEPDTESD